ncbi:MAG: NAD-dependent epimerase/dehydratase family protein [Candidatus Hodarchaeota archaeon]
MNSFSFDRVLNVGIVGAGYIANYHMEVLTRLKNVKVLGCCDVSLARAEKFRKCWELVSAYDDIDRFLEDNSFDIVHVLVPPDYHYTVAKKVIEHKVNVLLEKPMCVSSLECRELIRLAKQEALRIGVNHNAIFHPYFLRLQKDINKGRIGEMDHITYFKSMPLGQLEAGMFSHWMFQKPKNVLLEQAVHPISQVHSLIGELQDIKAMATDERELGHNQLFYARWQTIVKCERGSALLHLSFGRRYFPQNRILVSGQDGSIHVDLLNGLYLLQKKSIFPDYLDPLANAVAYCLPVTNGFKNFIDYALSKLKVRVRSDFFYVGIKNSLEAFYSSFSSNKEGPVPGEEGQKVVEFCEKWIEAARPRENPKTSEIKVIANKARDVQIFITGATGFIGRCLVEHFLRQGIAVRVLVRSLKGLPSLLHSELVEMVQGDLLDGDKIETAMQGIRYVFHLAHSLEQTWEDYRRVNVDGTCSLAEASLRARVKYFVFTSTIAAYYYADHSSNGKIDEYTPIDHKPERRNLYARHKITLENMLMQMHTTQGLPLIIFRPAIVIGNGGTLYHAGVGEWTRDNVCTYWGSGRNKLPFILVEDVVPAMARVLEIDNLEGEVFNLAGDIRFSAREYIAYLRKHTQRNIRAFPCPTYLRFLSETFKYLIKVLIGDYKNALLSYRDLRNRSILADIDNTKAKVLLNWLPNHNIEEFIHKAFGWAFEDK